MKAEYHTDIENLPKHEKNILEIGSQSKTVCERHN